MLWTEIDLYKETPSICAVLSRATCPLSETGSISYQKKTQHRHVLFEAVFGRVWAQLMHWHRKTIDDKITRGLKRQKHTRFMNCHLRCPKNRRPIVGSLSSIRRRMQQTLEISIRPTDGSDDWFHSLRCVSRQLAYHVSLARLGCGTNAVHCLCFTDER